MARKNSTSKKYTTVDEFLSNKTNAKGYTTTDDLLKPKRQQEARETVGKLLDDYNAAVREYGNVYNDTFFDSNGKTKIGYLSNLGEQGKAATYKAANIVSKRNAVQAAVAKWSDYLDNDYKASIDKYFADSNTELTRLNKEFQESYNYYSRFKDENDYKEYESYLAQEEVARKKEQDFLKTYDVEAAKSRINKLKGMLDLSPGKKAWERELEAAKNEYAMFIALTEKYNESPEDYVTVDPLRAQGQKNRRTLSTFAKANAAGGYVTAAGDGKMLDSYYFDRNPDEKFATFATDDEYAVYSRLIAKGESAAAEAFKKSLDEKLNARMTGEVYESLYKNSPDKYSFAVESGITSAVKNAGNFFGNLKSAFEGEDFKTTTPTEQQVFSHMASESKGLDKFIIEGLNTSAAMAPAVLLGFVPGIGSGLSGTMLYSQASGAAINEAKEKGYSDTQAMQYGTLVGASELALEKFLGGLPGIGKLSSKAEQALSGLDNMFFKVAGNGVLSGLSEYNEEFLQTYIEPYIATIVSGEEYDPPKLIDAAYQGLLGFATGAGMTTVASIPGEINTQLTGAEVMQSPDAVSKLVDLGRTIPETAKLSEKVATKPSAYKTGRLYERVRDSVTPENEEGVQRLAEIEESVYNAVPASSAITKEAADRINAAFTEEIDKTTLPESVKEAVARGFKLPEGIDPNSIEAEQYAREIANDAATAYEAGYIQERDGSKLKDGQLEELISVATPDQLKYYSDLGRERALSEAVEGDTRTYTADTPKRIEARKAFLSRSADEVRAATKADKTLSAKQREAAEYGEKLGVAVGFADLSKYYPSRRNGFSLKNKGIVIIDTNTAKPLQQVYIHELSHFSETAKGYAKLKETVLNSKLLDKWLTEQGFTGSLANKISAYRVKKKVDYEEHGVKLTKEGAEAELIANFIGETIGTEERFNTFMNELTSEQKRTFLEWLKDIWDKISGKNKVPAELRHIEKLFGKALTEAGENAKTKLTAKQEIALHKNGIGVDAENGVAWSIAYSPASIADVKQREAKIEEMSQFIHNVTGRSIEDCRKWVEAETSISAEIMQDPDMMAVATYEADDRYQAIKQNSDYPQGTVDLSNLCPKRSVFTWMISRLQEKYPDRLFDAVQLAEMRGILEKADIQVACALCFVEDRRQKVGEIAEIYKNMWKDAVESGRPLTKTNANGERKPMKITKRVAGVYGVDSGKYLYATDTYIPNQYDLTTYEGFKKLQVVHPQVAMGFEMYNNSRGQQAARLIEGRAEYKRQILEWSDKKVKQVNDAGGLRIFSFSDFEVAHLVDIIQIIIDCSAKSVKIQGYTKIPAFAKLVRNTGIKINRSLIPKGSGIKIVNGKKVLDYDLVEGMNMNDKNFLDEEDSADVGNVLVGINAEQIALAMADPFIDYIIPFHTNKSKAVCQALGLESWKNYKDSQHDKNNRTGKAAKKNINIYTEVLDVYHPKNKVEFVEAFLEVAKKKNYTPRFAEFLNTDANGNYVYTEGYHKFLVDFKLFDKQGNILPQGLVTPDLDANFMRELIASEVEKNKDFSQYEDVFAELDSEYGEQFSIPEKSSDGLKLTNAQRKFFRNSKVRDEKGRLLAVYHGTTHGAFTVFKDTDDIGYFFTNNKEVAGSYSGTEYMLEAKKPTLREHLDNYKGMRRIGFTPSEIPSAYPTHERVQYRQRRPREVNFKVYLNIENPLVVNGNGDLWWAVADHDADGNVISEAMKTRDWVRKAKEGDYDGVIFKSIVDNGSWNENAPSSDVYVALNPEQIKSVANKKPTNDPDIRYDIPEDRSVEPVEEETYGDSIPERARKLGKDFADGKISYPEYVEAEGKLLEEARETFGTIEEGENASVKANVPKSVEKKKIVSKYVRTILETGTVGDALATEMGRETLLGNFSHEVATDKNAQDYASASIKTGTAKEKWYRTASDIHTLPTKNEMAIGEALLAKAMKEGKSIEALEIISDLVQVYTRAGQVVQSASLLKKMTGAGRLIHLQRTVTRINEDIQKRHKDHPQITIGEDLAKELLGATSIEEIESVAQEIEQDVANQMKVTWLDKWNAWRYLSMLANPLTHARNVVGNAIFVPVVGLKNVIATGLEKTIPVEQRTRTLKIADEYMEFAKADAMSKEVQAILDGTDKMTGEAKLLRERRIFKNKVLHALSTLNKNALSAEDMIFKNHYYRFALASYLQAQNVDLSSVSEKTLNAARAFAVDEALKSTYNDASKIAQVIRKLENQNAFANILVNGLVPFKQTPINIVKRGVEYSPIGLINSLTFGLKKLKKGDISAAQFIDAVSAGSSGTIVFAIGMLLASLGWANGGFGDEDEDKFRQLAGEQEYSLQVFGKSYTLDWAAPINIPFFIGVELVKAMRNKNESFTLMDVSDIVWNSLDPIVNMSMLSGIESTISTIKNDEGAALIGGVLENVFTSYLGQAIPTIGGKVTGITHELRKSNYIDKNSQIPAWAQRMFNSAMAKSFGLYDKRNPYIDAWGRTVSQGGFIERVAENIFSPGYFNEIDYTDVDLKLMELYETTGEMSMFPDSAPKYFAVNGKRKDLTADEYVKYAMAKGQYSFAYLKEFFDSDYSKELSPEEQIKTIEKIYKYANDKAKAVVSDYDVEEKNKTVFKAEEDGGSVPAYFADTVKSERYAPSLYNEAMAQGNTEEAERLKADIISWKQENGKTKREAESELKQSITSYWKDKYIDAALEKNSAEMQRIQEVLKRTGFFPNPSGQVKLWYKEYELKKRKEEQKNK